MNDLNEELIQEAITHARQAGEGSVASLQRRMRLGYTRASMLMEELEKRGVVGSIKTDGKRDIIYNFDEVNS
jgi:DNA segregation ATPase FtsK/SpoIIIE-like protein